MFKPEQQHILDAVNYAASSIGASAYLYGNALYSSLLDKETKPDIFNFVLVKPSFDVKAFYSKLSEKIIINSEIESTSKVYYIISLPFGLRFLLIDDLGMLVSYPEMSFNVDNVLYDVSSGGIIDTYNIFDGKNKVIKSLLAEWSVKHIFGFAYHSSQTSFPIEENDNARLHSMSLSEIQSETDENDFLEILASDKPGDAIRFLRDTFKDGKDWTFNKLLESVISMNVPIEEGATKESVLSDKKFELVNIYSEFYLTSRAGYDSPENKEQRMTSALRILFDSPTLTIPKPYIDRIAVLSASQADESSATPELEVFSDCPYPPCTCNPSSCNPKCCCCQANYIVSQISASCHDRIHASCNQDGTAPGPNESEFPVSCVHCREMCDIVSGRTAGKSCSNLPSYDWWTTDYPSVPVKCTCKKWSDEDSGDCLLYCVQNIGQKCNSDIEVTGGNCSFRVALTPGSNCCNSNPASMSGFSVPSLGSVPATANIRLTLTPSTINMSANDTSSVEGSVVQPISYPSINIRPVSPSEPEIRVSVSNTHLDPYNRLDSFTLAIEVGKTARSGTYRSTITVSGIVLEGTTMNGFAMAQEFIWIIVEGVDGDPTPIPPAPGEEEVFPASCQCLDFTPIYVKKNLPECQSENAPDHCYDFDIQKFMPGQSQTECNNVISVTACGTTMTISPTGATVACCSEVGYGCSCPSTPCPPKQCCGPYCPTVCEPPNRRLFNNLKEAQNAVWCHCWTESAYVETTGCVACCCPDLEASPGDPLYPCDKLDPNNSTEKALLDQKRCCSCPSANQDICCNTCRLAFDDGNCGRFFKRRSEIDLEVEAAWKLCQGETPPSDIQCDDQISCPSDETISGVGAEDGCASVKNPSVAILNNGIGLVAYENVDDVSTIKIKQVKTSSVYKIMSNKEFNYGRLQNPSKWDEASGYYRVRLYFYEDQIGIGIGS